MAMTEAREDGLSREIDEKSARSLSTPPNASSSNHSISQSEKEAGKETEEQTPDSSDDDLYPKSFRLAAIVIALVLSVFLVSLDMTIVATAIPRITDQFHSLDDVGWYGSAFFLTLASFQSMWGKAYKYFPIKPTFLLSIFFFEVGSLICAVSKNSVTLIVGRAVAGAGGAGIASGAYTIIAFSARPKHRPAFTGVLGAVYGTASVIGPLLGDINVVRLKVS
jgi:MFS family permease